MQYFMLRRGKIMTQHHFLWDLTPRGSRGWGDEVIFLQIVHPSSASNHGFNLLSHRKHLKTRGNATQSLDQCLIFEDCTMQFVNCRPI